MPSIAVVIKAEIGRVVAKEIRRSGAVSEVKAIKRRLVLLEKAVASLGVQVARAAAAAGRPRAGKGEVKRGRRFRATPERLKEVRGKLGITQGQFARLLGVSGNAAWQWEAGRANPRGKTVKAIQALGLLGKREAARRLAKL